MQKLTPDMYTGFVRVLEDLESPGILFAMAFSRAGKSWKNAIDLGKFWKSVKLN